MRIGLLGASRIAREAVIEPAARQGHTVVAVAARDRQRAERYAVEHGVERTVADYAALVRDPEVDLVYNGLVNSQHARWNLAALVAGKHVLSEKPFSSNAAEASAVRDAALGSEGRIFEGFHYLHHPVVQRLREVVVSGRLGQLRRVAIRLDTPPPPEDDPRWSPEASGGATMDLGCYVLHAARQLGRWISGEPVLVSAAATESARHPGVDERLHVTLTYPDSLQVDARWDMRAAERRMPWTVDGALGVGHRAELRRPAPGQPD